MARLDPKQEPADGCRMWFPTVTEASQPLTRSTWFIRVAVPSYWTGHWKPRLFIVPAKERKP